MSGKLLQHTRALSHSHTFCTELSFHSESDFLHFHRCTEHLNADSSKICSTPGFGCLLFCPLWLTSIPTLSSFLAHYLLPINCITNKAFKSISCLIFTESPPVGHNLPQYGTPRLELTMPHKFCQSRESRSTVTLIWIPNIFRDSCKQSCWHIGTLYTYREEKNYYFLMNYY